MRQMGIILVCLVGGSVGAAPIARIEGPRTSAAFAPIRLRSVSQQAGQHQWYLVPIYLERPELAAAAHDGLQPYDDGRAVLFAGPPGVYRVILTVGADVQPLRDALSAAEATGELTIEQLQRLTTDIGSVSTADHAFLIESPAGTTPQADSEPPAEPEAQIGLEAMLERLPALAGQSGDGAGQPPIEDQLEAAARATGSADLRGEGEKIGGALELVAGLLRGSIMTPQAVLDNELIDAVALSVGDEPIDRWGSFLGLLLGKLQEVYDVAPRDGAENLAAVLVRTSSILSKL